MKKFMISILQGILKYIARAIIAKYNPMIIGITGSVGKTSAKEAVRNVIARERIVRAPSKNFNNELGLPLAIIGDFESIGGILFWIFVLCKGVYIIIIRNKSYPEVLILEYGVDRPGDMKKLLDIARPHVGIFSAMGKVPVHIEYFTGPDQVAKEKTKLIAQLPATGFAILNADDPLVMRAKNDTRAQILTFGMSEHADVRISNFSNHFDGHNTEISMKLTYGGSFVPVRINGALGESQAFTSAIACAVGLVFGMNLVSIAELLSKYEAPAGRLRCIQGIRESMIIDDTYNASPKAMENAVDTLASLPARRHIAVLGDMLELGKYTLEAHEEIGKMIKKKGIDILITLGLRGKLIAEAAQNAGMSSKSIFIADTIDEVVHFLETKIQKSDLLLVKGSQGVRMERIVKRIMAEPEHAYDRIARQNSEWIVKKGMYDEGE
ncbi:MAG: Mur ligase family protein [Candidatus Paceibacterota bacterium]|jgi:UDP-N-acetylmuramoyl-tripeptide--D-alanyl-D-alanine ligase